MDGLLSHYTSEQGMLGIANDGGIRSTEFLQLNDPLELSYALTEVLRAALTKFADKLPSSQTIDRSVFNQLTADNLAKEFKERVFDETLYVTSFARGLNQFENEQGVRTLWNEYTKHTGVCLQFSRGKLERLLERELEAYNYSGIVMKAIEYEINPNDSEFQWLAQQLELQISDYVAQHLGYNSYLSWSGETANLRDIGPRMLAYCCFHKDPSRRDEREFRVLAYPLSQACSRPLVGLALKKPVRYDAGVNNRRYITLGENMRPNLYPERVILGPKCALNLDHVRNCFENRPEVVKTKVMA